MNDYEELYDKIQDVTNDVNNYCGFQMMLSNPNQSEYKKELMAKMVELSTELSNVAHELEEHLAWD